MTNGYRELLVLVAVLAITPVSGCYDPFSYGRRAGGEGAIGDVSYEGDVYRLLIARCSACHEAGASAGATALVLGADPGGDFIMISALVAPGDPDGSALLQAASGAVPHTGGSQLLPGSADYQTLAAWIEGGATAQ